MSFQPVRIVCLCERARFETGVSSAFSASAGIEKQRGLEAEDRFVKGKTEYRWKGRGNAMKIERRGTTGRKDLIFGLTKKRPVTSVFLNALSPIGAVLYIAFPRLYVVRIPFTNSQRFLLGEVIQSRRDYSGGNWFAEWKLGARFCSAHLFSVPSSKKRYTKQKNATEP